MSKVCQITGRKAAVGNNVSHSKRRTKRKFKANLFNRRFFGQNNNCGFNSLFPQQASAQLIKSV